jgi:hypothetical protein
MRSHYDQQQGKEYQPAANQEHVAAKQLRFHYIFGVHFTLPLAKRHEGRLRIPSDEHPAMAREPLGKLLPLEAGRLV